MVSEIAKESKVFKNNRVEVIPNSLDTDVFRPIEKSIAKRELGIESDVKIILFGAGELTEKRKGFKYLLDATEYLKQDIYIQKLLKDNRLIILTFGRNNKALDDMNIPYKELDYVQDEEKLANIYSAADVMVIPSLQDNLPNTMLESIACGTPVVGFDVGGLKDCIIAGETGYLCKLKDTKELALNTVKAIKNVNLPKKCRELCLKKYTFQVQANAYKNLYSELLKEKNEVYMSEAESLDFFPELAQDMILYASKLYNIQRDELINANRLYLNAKNYYTKLDKNIIVLSNRNEEIKKQLIETNNKNEELNCINEELKNTNAGIRLELNESLRIKEKLEDDIVRFNSEMSKIYSSMSWKITKPLRITKSILKNMINKIKI